jgi:hypothetical protein
MAQQVMRSIIAIRIRGVSLSAAKCHGLPQALLYVEASRVELKDP